MGIENGRKSSRRDFLIGASAMALLAACDAGSILQSEDQKEDKKNGPQMGDIIVPKESAVVEGAEVLSVSAGNVNPLNPIDIFNSHGMALSHEKFLSLSVRTVGKNTSTS